MLDPIASVLGVVYDKLVGAIITLLGISHLIFYYLSLPLFQYCLRKYRSQTLNNLWMVQLYVRILNTYILFSVNI
jgi:hypothetical protein